VPIAEPLCELEAAVRVGTAAMPTWLYVWCAEFVEQAHYLFDGLFFEPWAVLDREAM